ncbi:FadR/GntR family transcriptional regulator [Actinomadura sp. WMMA1423]|uniref:FadR/GntR family transcriptional regulator n=1 Tax=Actinomadura sp. WMMA1423 TaxID=2591108 RepID=UPI00114765F5|nr:FadR/GntR family transcriptional regulator [Actinomadura sp. WMMA1423]
MIAPLPQPDNVRREAPGVELTRRLLSYLLSGELAPGQRIPSERQLAEALSAGRSTVREAIKSLSLLGLLEQRVGDGTYLSRSSSDLLPQVIEWGLLLGEKRLEDLLEARYVLEVQLAGWAAERRTDEQLRRLVESAHEMEVAGDDFDAYVQADIAFHLQLAEASGNSVLASVLTNVQSLLQAWASRVIRTAGETETSLAMHQPILKAVEERDAEAARAAMLAHMDRATRRLRASMLDGREGVA